MTPVEQIIERERDRLGIVKWKRNSTFADLGIVTESLASYLPKEGFNAVVCALLQARAEQIRAYAEDNTQHDQYRTGDSDLMACWPGCPRCELEDLATALEAAAKGVK